MGQTDTEPQTGTIQEERSVGRRRTAALALLGVLAALVLAAGAVVAVRHGEALPGTTCLLYTSPSPRDKRQSRMPSSA